MFSHTHTPPNIKKDESIKVIDISLAFSQHLVNFQLKKHTFVLTVAVNIDTSRHIGEKG